MADLSIRIDDTTKIQAEKICDELGITLTTAANIFFKQFVRTGGIPFDVKVDPFMSASNQAYIGERIAEYQANKATGVVKSLDEPRQME